MIHHHPLCASTPPSAPSQSPSRLGGPRRPSGGACAALAGIVAAVALLHLPGDPATIAAPPAQTGKRFFDLFTKKPTQPQEFIAAPTPPPLAMAAAAAKPVAPAVKKPEPLTPPTPRPVTAPPRAPTWDETISFARSLQTSAEKLVAAAVDPTYKPAPRPRTAMPVVSERPAVAAVSTPAPPAKPDAAAVKKVVSSRKGTAARPPDTRRFTRLRSLITDTLATYQRRPLNTAQNSPWEVMHGFIAFGIPTQVRVGGPSGDLVNAIGWSNMGGRCRGQVMLAAVGDRLVAQKGIGVQGHAAQYLAILAQCRVAINSPISVQSQSFTVADLVEEEKLSCRSKTELTFALIALAHYLPSDASWTSRDGKSWTLETLVAEEIEQPIRGAPCGGTHRLFGLAYGCQRRLMATGRLDGHYVRADKYVRDYQQFTLSKLQNSDGSFSTEWFKYPADREDDIDRKIQTTGHILEWLVASLDQEALYQPRILAAVEFLATSLARQPSRAWKIGPMGHALHALTIYQERAWGTVLPGSIAAFQGPMKAAPDETRVARQPDASATGVKPPARR